jgi:hypothetical protein
MAFCGMALVVGVACRGEERKEVRPPAPFAVVFIDAKTEGALGAFPYDRAVYAKGMETLARAEARGAVLKFFIDQPKPGDGDAALAAAMGKVKVIVQAKIDDSEKTPNDLPARFALKVAEGPAAEAASPITGTSGWLPIPKVAEAAHDLGFLDSTESLELVPVAVRYRGQYVKSLYTAALEMASGEAAKVVAGRSITFGGKTIATDKRCMAKVAWPAADGLVAYSFIDLINAKVPAEALKDRVVNVGYDGAKMATNETPVGKVRGHRVFCYQLFSLWERVK